MFEDATLRIKIAEVLDNFFVRFGTDLGHLPKTKIPELVDAMLPSFDTLGCTTNDREKIINELVKNYSAISTVYADVVVFLLNFTEIQLIRVFRPRKSWRICMRIFV